MGIAQVDIDSGNAKEIYKFLVCIADLLLVNDMVHM